jgi:hypothetical protein
MLGGKRKKRREGEKVDENKEEGEDRKRKWEELTSSYFGTN